LVAALLFAALLGDAFFLAPALPGRGEPPVLDDSAGTSSEAFPSPFLSFLPDFSPSSSFDLPFFLSLPFAFPASSKL